MGSIPASPDARNVPWLLCQERSNEASLSAKYAKRYAFFCISHTLLTKAQYEQQYTQLHKMQLLINACPGPGPGSSGVFPSRRLRSYYQYIDRHIDPRAVSGCRLLGHCVSTLSPRCSMTKLRITRLYDHALLCDSDYGNATSRF